MHTENSSGTRSYNLAGHMLQEVVSAKYLGINISKN